MTLTVPAATRATAATLALASFAVAGCGSSSTTEFTTPTTAAQTSYVTHTSRVPKVVSPDPVPVRVPVEYNARMAVRWAAWAEARKWCDDTNRGASCARLADEKFSDVAYNTRAEEEYRKKGMYETVYSTPPAATSYSTTTSVETVRPAGSGTGLVPKVDEDGKFASTLRMVVGAGIGALVLGGIAVVLVRRRRGGYRPAHTGAGAGTYDTAFDLGDLSTASKDDLFDTPSANNYGD